MKVQCEVETDVWRAARVFSLENGDTMGGVVTSALKEFLQDRVGPKPGDRKPENDVRLVRDNAGSSPAPGASKVVGVPVEYVEGGPILESCSKCGDKVPVSKLMMHPKFPNKKFCPDCVENMKNNQ